MAKDHTPPASPGPRSAGRLRWSLGLVALSLGYFVAGKAGLLLAVGNASVSVVWPATGLAIAALILWGPELWPAVLAGAFFVNLTTTGDPLSSAGIAVGNTLEGLIGAYLAVRFASGRFLLNQTRTLLNFVLLSGFLAATVAASIGTTSLVLTQNASFGSFPTVWARWWLGDAIGAIEVTPLILALFQRLSRPSPVSATPGSAEGTAVGLLTVGLALVVFDRAPSSFLGGYPLIFLVIPPIIWAAFRFGSLGAILSAASVSIIAILSTVAGAGPFATLPVADSLLALRIFMASVVVSALLVAADVSEHRWLESELYNARKELQRMLVQRTAQLDAAKSLAQVGTWTYDVGSGKVVWSDEMYRILGYGETQFPVVLDQTIDRVHPEDRELFRREIQAAIDSPDPFRHVSEELKLRLNLPVGEERTVLLKLHVAGTENGRATKVAGTVQDVSERERIERELVRLRRLEEPPPTGRLDLPVWMIPWSSSGRTRDRQTPPRRA